MRVLSRLIEPLKRIKSPYHSIRAFGMQWKLMAVGLVILAAMMALIFAYIVPDIGDSLKEEKELKTQEEVQTAWSVIDHYYQMELAGELTREEAQTQAIEAVKGMRYGPEMKDYFWINDFGPTMIMHPYKPQLDGTDLTENVDSEGNHLFVDFVDVCKAQGEGFSTYWWQYLDDANRNEKKTSYVKAHDGWGWIVGSGIYTVDVDEAVASTSNRLMLIVGIISAICLGILFILSRSIAKPIKKLTATADRIAEGDLTALANTAAAIAEGNLTESVEIETRQLEIKSNDEMGELARSFNKMIARLHQTGQSFSAMTENMRDLIGKVTENSQQLSKASDLLLASASDVNETTQHVASTSQQMAKGAADQAVSSQNAGKVVQQLNEVVAQISRGAQKQSENVREAVTSIEEVSKGAKQIAENAASAANGSKEASIAAREGADRSLQSVEGMKRIMTSVEGASLKVTDLGQQSEEIGKIVAVIDDIANQTNLLALNAAIEAARAGEHGRGFVVVSDEVRKLAERTGQATKEIAELISSVQTGVSETVKAMQEGTNEVQEGYRLANAAGESLDSILKTSNKVSQQIDQISVAAQEMSASAEDMVKVIDSVGSVTEENSTAAEQIKSNAMEVSQSVEMVSGVAEQSSASTQEVSASAEQMSAQMQEVVNSSQRLKQMAKGLLEAVSIFRTGNNNDDTPMEAKPA